VMCTESNVLLTLSYFVFSRFVLRVLSLPERAHACLGWLRMHRKVSIVPPRV
jgi:hypothetical protein